VLKHGSKEMLAEANAVIETISVQDLPYHLDDDMALLIDVREIHERENEGYIPNSLHISRGLLEFQVDPESPAYVKELTEANKLILYCDTGGRSALAAKTLIEMGFPDVALLAGGYAAWHLAQT